MALSFRLALVILAVVSGGLAFWLLEQVTLGVPQAYGVVLLAGGVVWAAGAVTSWTWFWSSGGPRHAVSLFGQRGARLFFAITGGTVAGMGLAILNAPTIEATIVRVV